MNDEQEAMDRVLRALGEAEPSAGMEMRLLAKLQEVAKNEAVDAVRPWWKSGARWAWVPLTLVTLIAVLWGGWHRSAKPAEAVITMPAGRRTAAGSAAGVSAPVMVASRSEASALHTKRTREGVTAVRPVAAAIPVEGTQQEASFPPPPLPLTEQERLLLRLKHRGDPVELAQLSLPERHAAEERDKQQVREFFRPPPLADPYGDRPAPPDTIEGSSIRTNSGETP